MSLCCGLFTAFQSNSVSSNRRLSEDSTGLQFSGRQRATENIFFSIFPLLISKGSHHSIRPSTAPRLMRTGSSFCSWGCQTDVTRTTQMSLHLQLQLLLPTGGKGRSCCLVAFFMTPCIYFFITLDCNLSFAIPCLLIVLHRGQQTVERCVID